MRTVHWGTTFPKLPVPFQTNSLEVASPLDSDRRGPDFRRNGETSTNTARSLSRPSCGQLSFKGALSKDETQAEFRLMLHMLEMPR